MHRDDRYRDELFDLAINKALGYVKRLGVEPQTVTDDVLKNKLELWYLKTRFAYRIPLSDIIATLQSYEEQHVWQGGKNGSWVKEDV